MAFSTQSVQVLLAAGRRSDAITLVDRAAAEGNPAALFQQAIWYLVGQVRQRDLLAARSALRRAVEQGSIDAALMEVALVANGTGGDADWLQATALLENAARTVPEARTQCRLLERMSIGSDGNPTALPPAERLCEAPSVLRYPAFLSPDECTYLKQIAEDLLTPAVVTDPRTGQLIAHPVRTSNVAVLGPTREDLVVQAILKRIAAATGTKVAQGEPLNILRYTRGQEYKLHSDALPHVANQRFKTALAYLNEECEGGGTAFPELDLIIRPAVGDLIVFANTMPDGRPDPVARHAGMPVTAGEKWVATRWIRERPFDVWNPA